MNNQNTGKTFVTIVNFKRFYRYSIDSFENNKKYGKEDNK